MPLLNANSVNLNRKSSIPSVAPKNLMKFSINHPLNAETLDEMNKQTAPEKDKMKQFADIRVKLNNKSPDRYDVESVPSAISQTDMWGELPKYEHYKH